MLSNKVKEIMNREVLTAGVTDTIWNVLELMVAKNVGRLIISDNKAPVGIFTEKDVMRRVMNKKLDLKKTSIKRVMTSPIRTVRENANMVEVLGKMYRGKFRHMLVCGEKGTMVGLVSMRRILKFAVELGRHLEETRTIGSIMSGHLLTVDAAQSIADTLGAMTKKGTTCVVVFNHGEPQGIFTERDVLTRVAIKNIDTRKTAIQEVMTANPVTMSDSSLIGEVLSAMYKGDFRHMPLRKEGGELIGIVSIFDVLKYAKALDVDESVRRAWKEIKEYWDSDEQYTPG